MLLVFVSLRANVAESQHNVDSNRITLVLIAKIVSEDFNQGVFRLANIGANPVIALALCEKGD